MIKGLYLITDDDRDGRLIDRVRDALRGGVRVLQYRDKSLSSAQQITLGRQLKELCRSHKVIFLVNDSPEIALQCGADGVHLGQGDGSATEARRILGPAKIVGLSARTLEQAKRAESDGADYIGLGSMYPTDTKPDHLLIGPETLRRVRKEVGIPIVAIGGITRDRAAEVIDAGADALAVVSAVMGDSSPAIAAREIALQFNRRNPFPRGRVLTIAGSDSGGGAGIQADLKTATLLGSYGMSALTALTAQNTLGVRGIHRVPAEFVREQIEAVLSDLGADIIKTGMLNTAEIVEVVAHEIEVHALPAVVDPVMIAKGGSPLLQSEAVEAVRKKLLPVSYLLTPNLHEAEALTGIQISSEKTMEEAALRLREMGARNVLVKGGHLQGEAIDLLLLAEGKFLRFPGSRFNILNTHGTGCTFAAAIASFLAQGLPLREAVGQAKIFISEAIRTALPMGGGHGPVNHWEAAKALNP